MAWRGLYGRPYDRSMVADVSYIARDMFGIGFHSFALLSCVLPSVGGSTVTPFSSSASSAITTTNDDLRRPPAPIATTSPVVSYAARKQHNNSLPWIYSLVSYSGIRFPNSNALPASTIPRYNTEAWHSSNPTEEPKTVFCFIATAAQRQCIFVSNTTAAAPPSHPRYFWRREAQEATTTVAAPCDRTHK